MEDLLLRLYFLLRLSSDLGGDVVGLAVGGQMNASAAEGCIL